MTNNRGIIDIGMDCSQVEDFLSAAVDGDFSDMSEREVITLNRLIYDCPECFSELQLDRATKFFLIRHTQDVRCPGFIVSQIQSGIYHMYQTFRRLAGN